MQAQCSRSLQRMAAHSSSWKDLLGRPQPGYPTPQKLEFLLSKERQSPAMEGASLLQKRLPSQGTGESLFEGPRLDTWRPYNQTIADPHGSVAGNVACIDMQISRNSRNLHPLVCSAHHNKVYMADSAHGTLWQPAFVYIFWASLLC